MQGFDKDFEEARKFLRYLKEENLLVLTKDDLSYSYSNFRAKVRSSTPAYNIHHLLRALKTIRAIKGWKGYEVEWNHEAALHHASVSRGLGGVEQFDSEEEIVWNGSGDMAARPANSSPAWPLNFKEDEALVVGRSKQDNDQYAVLQDFLSRTKSEEGHSVFRKNEATNKEDNQRGKLCRGAKLGTPQYVKKVNSQGLGGVLKGGLQGAKSNTCSGTLRSTHNVGMQHSECERRACENETSCQGNRLDGSSTKMRGKNASEGPSSKLRAGKEKMFLKSEKDVTSSGIDSEVLSRTFAASLKLSSDGTRPKKPDKKERKSTQVWVPTCEMQGDVAVSTPFPGNGKGFQMIDLNKMERSSFSVTNKGTKSVRLLYIRLIYEFPKGSFALAFESHPSCSSPTAANESCLKSNTTRSLNPLCLPVFANLPPSTSMSFQVSCTARDVGYHKAAILAECGNQNAVKYVTLIAEDDVAKSLAPTEAYSRRTVRKAFYKIVHGRPPPVPGFARRLGFFQIPEDLKHTLMKDHTLPVFLHGLSFESYQEYFSSLLFAEELQWKADISAYDMQNVSIHQDRSGYFVLRVPGLLERRPSVIYRDAIFVRPMGAKEEYQGFVYRVQMEEVFLKFPDAFHACFIPNQRYDVRFSYSRVTLRRGHHAINASKHLEKNLLFPYTVRHAIATPPQDSFSPFNRALNEEQRAAVLEILRRVGAPPYLVYGPPGTGKTVTVVEAILQVLKSKSDVRILACAPSNAASDVLLERLRGYVQVMDMLRLNAYTRPLEDMAPDLLPYCSRDDSFFACPSLQELIKYKVVVSTYWSAGLLEAQDLMRGHFSHIFLDECGQGMEPETLIPVANFASPRTVLVLAGDHRQLGPVIRSSIAQKFGLGMSLLERLSTLPLYSRSQTKGANAFEFNKAAVTKLVRNYRSHPAILDLPSRLFYDGELIASSPPEICSSLCRWEELPNKSFPVLFVGVDGRDEREGKNPSWFNAQEASKVVGIVGKLKEAKGIGLTESDIGIITPYSQQVKKIKSALASRNMKSVKVGSVEQFQGQEKRVIIISTVRSSQEFLESDIIQRIEFLGNPKRFNVAITRAKALLVIVGNPYILCQDKYWGELLQYCIAHKSYVGCTLPAERAVSDNIFKKYMDEMNTAANVMPTPDGSTSFEKQWLDGTC